MYIVQPFHQQLPAKTTPAKQPLDKKTPLTQKNNNTTPIVCSPTDTLYFNNRAYHAYANNIHMDIMYVYEAEI